MGMMRTFSPVEVLSDDWWSSGCSDHTSTLRSANFLKLPNFGVCARNRFTGIWWICELLALPSSDSSGQQGVMRSCPFLSLNGAMGAGRWSLCVHAYHASYQADKSRFRAASRSAKCNKRSDSSATFTEFRPSRPSILLCIQVFDKWIRTAVWGLGIVSDRIVSYCIVLL